MFSRDVLPVYVRRSPEKATTELAEVLRKLKVQDDSRELQQTSSSSEPLTTVSRPSRIKFRLNDASEEDTSDTLLAIHGIGLISVNKIIAERLVNGDFLGREDFDRRVKGIKFARLEHLCAQGNVTLSLSPSSAPTRRVGRPRHHIHDSNVIAGPSATADETSLVLATWNTGRMSRRGAFYEAKMGHLLRFVDDCGAHVLMLQEVCRGVGRDMSRRLSAEFGVSWMLHHDEFGDRSLVMLYRSDRAMMSVLPTDGSPNIFGLTENFQRRPQLAFVHANEYPSESFAIINVHLHQADPRPEISSIAEVVTLVERFLRRKGQIASVMVVGDFNLNADSKAFDRLRRRRMVELVCPERLIAPHPYQVLHAETTVGGQWYDNFWVAERKRPCVREAWCFDFGGRRRNLKQSGYEFAAEKRSSSSDHLPLVLRISVGMDRAGSLRSVKDKRGSLRSSEQSVDVNIDGQGR